MLVLRRCFVGITLWLDSLGKDFVENMPQGGLRLYTMLKAPAEPLARRQNPRCRVYP
jgi:hypothetical protein